MPVTTAKFRSLALDLPGVVESEHMSHPDFRVGGKIFATLWSDGEWGMVKLTPVQQAELVRDEGDVYEPAQGAWGRRGATKVRLASAKTSSVQRAILAAWRNTAPKRLLRELDEE